MTFDVRLGLILSLLVCWKIAAAIETATVNKEKPLKHVNLTKKIFQRIIGGHTCAIQNHPYLVSIQNKKFSPGHFCAGTLLSARWVLTAKHCFLPNCKDVANYVVLAGVDIAYKNYISINIKLINLNEQESPITKCFMHPLRNFKADIALLLLQKSFRKTPFVNFVKLPSPSSNGDLETICRKAIIMGWGVQFPADESLNIVDSREDILPHDPFLKCSEISVVSKDECQDKLSPILIHESLVCAFRKNIDICRGDAGGPLICNGVQYGIASFGAGCALDDNPGVYTKVQYFLNYIQNVTSTEYRYRCGTAYCSAPGSLPNAAIFGHILSLAVGLLWF